MRLASRQITVLRRHLHSSPSGYVPAIRDSFTNPPLLRHYFTTTPPLLKLAARLLLFREPIGQFSLFHWRRQFSLGAFGITSLTVAQTSNVYSPAELAKLARPALSRGEFRPFTFTVWTDTVGSNKLSGWHRVKLSFILSNAER